MPTQTLMVRAIQGILMTGLGMLAMCDTLVLMLSGAILILSAIALDRFLHRQGGASSRQASF